MVLVWKSLQGLILLPQYINDSFDDIVCNSANYADDSSKKQFTDPTTQHGQPESCSNFSLHDIRFMEVRFNKK